MSAFAIDSYIRIKDDMFIVAQDRKPTKHHVRSMNQRARKTHISEVTVISSKYVSGKKASRVVTAPEFKPTSLLQPPGYECAHAPRCVASWPSARIIMSRALTRRPIMFIKTKSELIERLREHLVPESVMKMFAKHRWHASHQTRPQPEKHLVITWVPSCNEARDCCVSGVPRVVQWLRMGVLGKSAHESEFFGRTRCHKCLT